MLQRDTATAHKDWLEENEEPAAYPGFDLHASYTEEDTKLDCRKDCQADP